MFSSFQCCDLLAYVGPGAGLGLLGALAGLAIALFSALGFMLLWPLRALMRKMNSQGADQ